jgi:hypothetical protein
MMFDADISVSGQNLCAATQPFRPVPPAPGETNRLLAAFCGGTEAISEVAGWAYGGVKGVEDPLFRNLVARVTNSIFPKTASTLDIGITGSSF